MLQSMAKQQSLECVLQNASYREEISQDMSIWWRVENWLHTLEHKSLHQPDIHVCEKIAFVVFILTSGYWYMAGLGEFDTTE